MFYCVLVPSAFLSKLDLIFVSSGIFNEFFFVFVFFLISALPMPYLLLLLDMQHYSYQPNLSRWKSKLGINW